MSERIHTISRLIEAVIDLNKRVSKLENNNIEKYNQDFKCVRTHTDLTDKQYKKFFGGKK